MNKLPYKKVLKFSKVFNPQASTEERPQSRRNRKREQSSHRNSKHINKRIHRMVLRRPFIANRIL